MKKKTTEKIIRNAVGLPSKKEAAVVGLAALGTLIVASEIEKNNPEFAEYKVDGKGKVPAPVRFVFLSDLHEKEFGEGNERLLDMIDEADPDAILIGGDMINNKRSLRMDVTLRLCEALAKKYPIYYANGNHEQRLDPLDAEAFERKLRRMGIKYLQNETAVFNGIAISGLDIEKSMYAPVKPEQMSADYIRFKIGELDTGRFNILLVHSPLFTDAYEKSGADLALCGHFHGGTIGLPDNVGLMTPQYQLFSKKVVGSIQKNGLTEIVSAGLGTHSINIRINDRPQVVVVDIRN